MDIPSLQKRWRAVLTPLSRVYREVMRVRRQRWERAESAALRPVCPCLSVGNIAWGGTGKTPVVDWLLGWAEGRGLRTVVLTRGYGARPSALPLRVCSEHSPQEAGDEPLMLALAHPESVVLVDPDRRRAARWAQERLAPELFVLDDGLQHVKIRRDLDLVLLRPDDVGDGWERVIPAGAWREGAAALDRAGAFLIKCSPEELEALRPALEARLNTDSIPRRPVFSFSLRPVGLEHLTSGVQGDDLAGSAYTLVSGVGDPEQVVRTATAFLGRSPQQVIRFPDHHAYTLEDAARLEALGMPVLCTAKDAVKLRALPVSRVWVLQVETVFGPFLWTDRAFPRWLDMWAADRIAHCQPGASAAESFTV